jgi:hypothetical protein
MHYLSSIALFTVALLSAAAKDIPHFDESFSTKIVEVNGITTTIPSSGDELSVVVTESLVMDAQNRRKYLYAETTQGVMNQIQRCDLAPSSAGYLMNAEGRPSEVNDPSKWSCTNTTIPIEAESAENCQYGTFWSELYTSKFEYKGITIVNGVTCDTWNQVGNPQQQLVVYALSVIPFSPVAIGTTSGQALYTMFFTEYIPGVANDDAYDAVDGVNCPEATPDQQDKAARVRSISSIRSLFSKYGG